ncbi:LuxR family transcriptional regulator [Streptomyces sp. NPDC056144]|uniref:LuxR family transcriptional regulator n=1 Tax=unclassified Streptomyces TaxID=2593676 RepID=UPI0035DE7B55
MLEFDLVRRLSNDEYTPLAPRMAASARMGRLEEAIQEKQRALEAMRASVFEAERVYLDSQVWGKARLIREIRGAEAISTTLSAAVRSCRRELLTAQPGGGRPQELLETALADDLSALGRGIRQKTLYQHTIRSHSPTLAYAERICEAGGEIRTVDEVFDRLIICDREIAFVPDPEAVRSDLALAIEHPGVVRYLVGVFHHTWQRASPIRSEVMSHVTPSVTNDIRRAVLQLMIEGHTDAVIASRLGMSLRSVTNHMRWASDLFGSRSRAQLAYRIARSGFLDEPNGDSPVAEAC